MEPVSRLHGFLSLDTDLFIVISSSYCISSDGCSCSSSSSIVMAIPVFVVFITTKI